MKLFKIAWMLAAGLLVSQQVYAGEWRADRLRGAS